MGNTTSSTKRARVHKELERFLKPTGLYPTCAWDDRQIRKLIMDGRIAPRFIGFETKYQGTDECPICFMRYCAVNRTACCKKPICSECYLQVKSPRGATACPFCNHVKMQSTYGIDDEDKMIDKELEVIALHDKISEAEEKGELLVPVVNGAGEDGLEMEVGSAETVYANAPLATVDDRRNIEAEVRKQFELDRPPSRQETHHQEARPGRGVRRLGGGTSGMQQQRRGTEGTTRRAQSSDEGDLRRAVLQSLGLPRDLQHVEELMLMEAIRQSICEKQARVQQEDEMAGTQGHQQQQQHSPADSGGRRGGASAADADTKEEQPDSQGVDGGQGLVAGVARLLQRVSLDDEQRFRLAMSMSQQQEEEGHGTAAGAPAMPQVTNGGEEEGKEEQAGSRDSSTIRERSRRSWSLSSSSSFMASTASGGGGGGGQVVMSDGNNLFSRDSTGSRTTTAAGL